MVKIEWSDEAKQAFRTHLGYTNESQNSNQKY